MAERRSLVQEIETWYERAPAHLEEGEIVRWVQRHAEIACPECGDPLWIMRTRRAQNRGFYHLAMCNNPDCTFQFDD